MRLRVLVCLCALAASPAWAQQGAELNTTRRPLPVARPLKLKAITFKQPVTTVTIKRPAVKLLRIRPIKPVVKPVKPQGPDPHATLDLSDAIDDAALVEDLGQACGWDGHLLFQDQKADHVFYYLPREFLLKRDPAGYRLSVQYNTRTTADRPAVMLTAELAAPHRTGDVALLKAVLRKALGLSANARLEVKALPGLGAKADFAVLRTGFTLPAERIHFTPPAHLKQSFRLTLALSQDEVEEIMAQIAREGLVGNLKVQVGEQQVPVPIRIQYDRFVGPKFKGFAEWTQGRTITHLANLTDFPAAIDAINAYRLRNGQLERVSKKLKPVAIAPSKQRPFKLPPAQKLLGANLMVAWLGASLDSSCATCLKTVDRSVRKGIALAPGSRLNLEVIPSVFEEFGLYKLIVHVQSPYFNAGGGPVQQKEVSLTPDVHTSSDVRLFVPDNKGGSPLLYKYRLEVVTEDGDSRLEEQWHEGRKLTQFFGARQLEGLLPGGTGTGGDDAQ